VATRTLDDVHFPRVPFCLFRDIIGKFRLHTDGISQFQSLKLLSTVLYIVFDHTTYDSTQRIREQHYDLLLCEVS